ncbi:hypothetical protein S40285_10189 [Stachybotrys chlorohalonatus IBT 40285]|uniref:Uncharacterized protein n=1 Tax=Stachybotrys chlorohalonatus (strain IBT 40285) TaxID=1283841 RepID=A0A084QJC9_STAC4|nr:hypothetical protein S40285_10189 [Stachybotrys chlorohalonata IBT 40285]
MSSSRQSGGSSRRDTLQLAPAVRPASRSTGSSPSDASPVLGGRPDGPSAGGYQTIASLMASRQSGAPPVTVYQPSPPLEVISQPIELQSPAARPLQSVAMSRMHTPANATAQSPVEYRAVMQQPTTRTVAVPEQRLYNAVTSSHHQHPYHWAQMSAADMPEHHGVWSSSSCHPLSDTSKDYNQRTRPELTPRTGMTFLYQSFATLSQAPRSSPGAMPRLRPYICTSAPPKSSLPPLLTPATLRDPATHPRFQG